MTCTCNGIGWINAEICNVSGAKLAKTCLDCDGSGIKLRTFYANIMCHKNHGEDIFMHSTLYNSRDTAEKYRHPEHFLVKTIEVKV